MNLAIFVKVSPFGLTLSKSDGYFPVDSTPPRDDNATFWCSTLDQRWKKVGFPITTETFKTAGLVGASVAVAAMASEADGLAAADGVAGASDRSDASNTSNASNASNTSDASDVAGATDDTRADRVVEILPVQLATGRWSRWIAVAGGFGYVPLAPGTAGSVAGVLVFWLVGMGAAAVGVPGPGFIALYAVAVASLLLIGIHASGRAETDFGRRDDGRIVIDEVVGQLITLAPLAPLLWALETASSTANGFISANGPTTHDGLLFFFEVVTGFVLFRLFDVWKPGAIGWVERRFHGGLGVMADDVVAGIHAALCLFVLHTLVFERFYSGWPILLNASRAESAISLLGVSL